MIYCAREDIGRSGEVAAAFFVATLSPMLGFIMLYTFRFSFVADHYQYAACIGPIALVSAGIVMLADSWKKYRNAIYAGAAAIVLLGLGVLTWQQCHIYLDGETIWRDTIAKKSRLASWRISISPTSLVLPTRGEIYRGIALQHYNRAVEVDPTFTDSRFNRADPLGGHGQAGGGIGRLLGAASSSIPATYIAQNGFGTLVAKNG